MEQNTRDAKSNNTNKLDVPELLSKLNIIYDKEEELKSQIIKLMLEYKQIQDDKELMQYMIMHRSNKNSRLFKYKGVR